MKVLMIGDVVGRAGRRAVRKTLPDLKQDVDFIIANGENAAGGFGLTKGVVEELVDYGVDLLTTGNHVWDNKDIFNFIEDSNYVIRPYNYPPQTPGVGFKIINADNFKLGVINLIGRVYLGNYDCPFRAADKIISKLENKVDAIIIDFHAEATSEKVALGKYLDGKATAVLGTHTHVQTADETILSKGTAYITDVGFSGAQDSILGMDPEEPLKGFLSQMPTRFKVGTGDTRFQGVIIKVENNGLASSIKRLEKDHVNN
ncbi:MAG: TIGR00282 family metallophosphoesterase [Bacillota bacterium]